MSQTYQRMLELEKVQMHEAEAEQLQTGVAGS